MVPRSAHDSRLATSFDSVAGEYARGRPGYPREALDRLTEELELTRSSTIVDLAAGTGKLTTELVGRFDRVIAVEPLAGMRRELESAAPEAEALDGSAEDMPLADSTADAVFVAQAFHWFDGDRALGEIARVLRPGGALALLWNTTPWEEREGPWFAALDDLLEERRVDLHTLRRHASGLWRRAFQHDKLFEPLSSAIFPNASRSTRADFVAAFMSRSYIAALPETQRAEVLEAIAGMLDREDAPVDGDIVTAPMRTGVFWTRLRS